MSDITLKLDYKEACIIANTMKHHLNNKTMYAERATERLANATAESFKKEFESYNNDANFVRRYQEELNVLETVRKEINKYRNRAR